MKLPIGAKCRCGGTIVEWKGQVGCSKCGTFSDPDRPSPAPTQETS